MNRLVLYCLRVVTALAIAVLVGGVTYTIGEKFSYQGSWWAGLLATTLTAVVMKGWYAKK